MKVLKKFLPPVLILLFTAAAVFLPPVLSKIRDSVDFAGPTIEEAPFTEAEAKPALADSLALIAGAQTGEANILASSQYFSTAPNEGLLKSVTRELNALSSQVFSSEGLPYYFSELLGFSEDSSYWSYSLVTCTDSSRPFYSASFWSLRWSGEDFSLEIHMETATEKIFTLSIEDNTGSLFSLFSHSGSDFMDYEGSFQEPPLIFFPFSPEEFFGQLGDYLGLPLSVPVFDDWRNAYCASAQGQAYSFLLQEEMQGEYSHIDFILLTP